MMNIIAASRLRGQEFEPNTFITDSSGTLNTAADLANRTTLSISDVKSFQKVGDNVSFYVNVNYDIFASDFSSLKNQLVRNYIDLEGKVINIGDSAFGIGSAGGKGLLTAYFPNAIQSTRITYRNNIDLKYLIYDSIQTIAINGGEFLEDLGFTGVNPTLFCPIAQQTINSGSPDPNIVTLLNQGGNVVYKDTNNYTSPLAPTISETTNIGGTFVELNVSQPTHINTLKYALVFVDGFFQNVYDINNVFATNLQEQTIYNIKVIIADEYFNISPYSNTINVTTTTTPALFKNAVSYYKLDEINGGAIDVVSGYNGTLIGGVTQGVAGKIGTAYTFDGSSGYVNTDLNNIGVNSFTVGCWFKSIQTSGISRILSFRGNGALGTRNGFQISPNFDSNNWSNTAIDDGNGNGILFTAPLNENDGNWHLVILRFDSSTGEANLIIDNTIVETITEPNLIGFNVTGFPLSIAAATESLGQFYQGEIDEIFIQQTKLDLGEISDLYNNGNGTTI